MLQNIEDVKERVTTGQLVAGEVILERKLASAAAGRGLSALIPKNMRAYTIETTRLASNVAGFILPGNKVDVLLNLKGCAGDTTGGGSTTTLLQAVEVLAAAQRVEAPQDNRVDPKELSSVTLLVTPDQATVLDLGQNMGVLTLALRNPEDDQLAATQPATIADIRFLQKGPLEKVPSPPQAEKRGEEDPGRTIVTLRGRHRGRVLVAEGTGGRL
jgi:pilus assembly protein CpaB